MHSAEFRMFRPYYFKAPRSRVKLRLDPEILVPTCYGLFRMTSFSIHGRYWPSWVGDYAVITHGEAALHRRDPATGITMSMRIRFDRDREE